MSTRTNSPTTSAPTPARDAVKRSAAAPLATASSTSSTRRPATSAPRAGGAARAWDRAGARVAHQQHPAAGDVGPADRRLVELVALVSRLADERERQPRGQR